MATAGALRRFYLILGALVVVGGLALFLAARRSSEPAGAAPAAAPAPGDDAFQGYAKGSSEAPVEVVEYSDFQCPYCAQLAVVQLPDIEKRLIATRRVRWRFRDFPLEIHRHARLAARAAQCAGEQNRFWEMHDALLWRQREWAEARDPTGKFEDYARAAGLDRNAFGDCLASTRYDARIEASFQEGRARGVTGTPALFVNGQKFGGDLSADALVRLVDSLAPPSR